jgi:hypothetical protein
MCFQGINVVQSQQPAITHHLIPSYVLTPTVAASLLSLATLVKSDWLRELLSLGALAPEEPGALEAEFSLPSEDAFRPGFSNSLLHEYKQASIWSRDERRRGMFHQCRFIFAGEKGREVSTEYRELVVRGGGSYEAFTVSSGVMRWRKILEKSRAWVEDHKGKTVIVADSEAAMAAVGRDTWHEMCSIAKE